MSYPIVKIIADSISDENIRITTMQLRYWRPIHPEFMTHRVFSRNAGSSRARPSAAIIEQVRNDPWGPLFWGANQPGMQAETELSETLINNAKRIWHEAANQAADNAEALMNIGAHKQIVNRILEPYSYIDVVVTATEWDNFFQLRDHPAAQPEIQALAREMRKALENSTPTKLEYGEWHLPYITEADKDNVYSYLKRGRVTKDEPTNGEILELLRYISAARCARVSYKAFDGTNTTIEADLDLCGKLLSTNPAHASPFEHQATPDSLECDEWDSFDLHGNLYGWKQYRKMICWSVL